MICYFLPQSGLTPMGHPLFGKGAVATAAVGGGSGSPEIRRIGVLPANFEFFYGFSTEFASVILRSSRA